MANEVTKLTIPEIISAIGDIEKIMSDNEAMIKALDDIILKRLPVAWECEASRAYSEAYAGYKKTILPKFTALLATYKATLTQTANSLGASDADIVKMVQSYVVSQ